MLEAAILEAQRHCFSALQRAEIAEIAGSIRFE